MNLPAAVCVPELRPLWMAMHGRLSTGRRVSSVRVGPLDEAQRDAVADLLGLARRPGTHCSVSLGTLETVLDDLGTDVTEVVTDLVGPVGDRAAERARAEAERTALWEWLEHHPEVRGRPALGEWARQVRRAGVRGS
ncbi:TIGR02679 domain-containing protein, partial [Saccharomonospora iraqiensis]|uniref:TIGR02679 domain-containing protein n=1 Tax=Saccharomonospora iraqiensis TaxID=52698 RepID=UPI00055006F6